MSGLVGRSLCPGVPGQDGEINVFMDHGSQAPSKNRRLTVRYGNDSTEASLRNGRMHV